MTGHRHQVPHLLVVVDGDIDEREDRRTHEMRRGSFRVSGADVTHDLWFGSRGANCLVVEAGGVFWTRVFARGVRGAPLGVFGDTNAAAMLSTVDSAETLVGRPGALRAFGQIMARSDAGAEAAPSWIEDAVGYIEAGQAGSLLRMAQTLSRDRVHLARTFGAWLGFRPVEYRALRRAAAAIEAIKASDAPLAEVALACGYTHQSHMNRAFKDLFGHTPAHWRADASFLQDSAWARS